MPQPDHAFRLVAITLSAQAVISALSPGAEQRVGYSGRELIGRPITHILADRSAFEFSRMMESAREFGGWEGEVVFLNRSGEQLLTRGSICTLAGNAHPHAAFLLISTSDRVSAPTFEECTALQETGARLRTLSHEMNNPLAVMMGFMQLIMLDPHCTGKVRGDMEKLISEMNRVVHVVERLHQYAVALQEEPNDRQVDFMAG